MTDADTTEGVRCLVAALEAARARGYAAGVEESALVCDGYASRLNGWALPTLGDRVRDVAALVRLLTPTAPR